MSLNKEAYIRYSIIDACLNNPTKPFPAMGELIEACEHKLGKEFSKSTIQKDILAMRDDEALNFHAPIKFKKSKNGYYYSRPFSIRTVPLNETDVEALKAAVDMLGVYSGSRVSENFGQAVEKIFASINERFPGGNIKRKIIQTDDPPPRKGFEFFELFMHAAKEKIPVSIIHYSYTNRVFNSGILHPMILKEFQNNWYVVGYSENHGEVRTFGLDRLYDPVLVKRKFIEPKEKEREEYLKDVYGVYPLPGEKRQEIIFTAQPMLADFLQARPMHASQKVKKVFNYGHAIFSLNLVPSQELINFFLSFSLHLRVEKPEWMHKQIISYHVKVLSNEKKQREGIYHY